MTGVSDLSAVMPIPRSTAAARRQLAKAGLPAGTLDATRGFLIVPATQSQLNALDGRASQAERGGPGAAMAGIRAGAGGLVTELVTEPVVPKAHGVLPGWANLASGTQSFNGLSWPSRTGTPQGCALITGDGNPIRGQAQGRGGDGSPLGLQGAARLNAAGSDAGR